MKALNNWRMQIRKLAIARRCGPKPQAFKAELRQGIGQHIVVDTPKLTGTGYRQKPGSRIWFTRIGSGLLIAGRPKGPRDDGRYSSRLVRTHVPFRLVMQYRRDERDKRLGQGRR